MYRHVPTLIYMHEHMYNIHYALHKMIYCGIILIRGIQCSWMVNILLVRGNEILWVTGLLHNNARQFISLLNVLGDVNSWVRVTHEIHEH